MRFTFSLSVTCLSVLSLIAAAPMPVGKRSSVICVLYQQTEAISSTASEFNEDIASGGSSGTPPAHDWVSDMATAG